MGKQWELWADIAVGGLLDILRQLDHQGAGSVDGNAAGSTLLVRTDGPKPAWLQEVKDALDERGIPCSLS